MIRFNGPIYDTEYRGTPDKFWTEEVERMRTYYTCTMCQMRYNFKNKKQLLATFKYEDGYGIVPRRTVLCNKCAARRKTSSKNYIYERKLALNL